MNKILENYKSNIPIILLLIYSLGYVYLNRFYSRFDIAIENYVSLTDMLFFTINIIVYTLFIFSCIEIVLITVTEILLSAIYQIKYRKEIEKAKDKEKYLEEVISPRIRHHFAGTSLTIFTLAFIVYYFFGFRPLYSATIFMALFFLKLYSLIRKIQTTDDDKKDFANFFAIIMVPIAILCFAIWGIVDGNSAKKTNANSHDVEFVVGNCKFTTNKSDYTFVGETSSNIFLYNKKEKKTEIFLKDNLNDYKINDPSNISRLSKFVEDFFTE